MQLCLSESSLCVQTDAQLALLIASGDPIAIEQLYGYLMCSLRPIVRWRLPEHEPDDILHEAFAISLEAIQNGLLRNPWAIRTYVQGVLKRLIAGRIGHVIEDRKKRVNEQYLLCHPCFSASPESSTLHHEREEMLARGMRLLQKRDSELLTRFYIQGQPSQDICREMHITRQQFKNFKHRAKATLTEWVITEEALA